MAGGMSVGRRRSEVALMGLALAACVALLMALLPASVQSATARHNVYAWLDNSCVGGAGPKGAWLQVTWKSATGTLKKRGRVKASSKGRWSLCTSSKRVAQGDRITAKLGTKSLTAVVPRLDVSVDRESSVVSGLTKPRQQLVIQALLVAGAVPRHALRSPSRPRLTMPGASRPTWTRSSARATCSAATSPRPSPSAPASPHVFGRLQRVPYVEVVLGDDTLSGALRARQIAHGRAAGLRSEPEGRLEW